MAIAPILTPFAMLLELVIFGMGVWFIEHSLAVGSTLLVAGGLLVAAGALLIWLRSRRD